MSIVKKNLVANLLGKSLSVALSLFFIPIYLKYLGVEAFGIIGVFGILQSIFMIADIGMSATLTREIARLSTLQKNVQQMRNICHTFEIIFVVLGLIIGVIIVILSTQISEKWINLNNLSENEVSNSIMLMGLAIGIQFPFYICQGGLQGLQRQVNLNLLILIVSIIRGFGAIFILKYVDSTINAFFIWQVIMNVIQLILGHLMLWKNLPEINKKSKFELNLIRPIWRFTVGTAGTTFIGILLSQADKLILTKLLPLEQFGYYSLASTVASLTGMVAIPFSNAIYPKLIQLVADNNYIEIEKFYHKCCQVLSVIILPLGTFGVFFSKEIILIWTGDPAIAMKTYQYASILTLGTTLMGLMIMPYTLQLAYGWTKLGLYFNIFAAMTLMPALIWIVSIYGVFGACFVWVLIYLAQITIVVNLMHKRILKNEKWNWYINDVIKPFVLPFLIIALGRVLIVEFNNTLELVINLTFLLFAATCVSMLCAPIVREIIYIKFSNKTIEN